MRDHVEPGARKPPFATVTSGDSEPDDRPAIERDPVVEPGADGSSVQQGSADIAGAGLADRDAG